MRRSWFDEHGVVVASPAGERHVPVYAGALHYWRVPPIRWGASLRALHAQGFTCVETPVPWRVHEPDLGSLLWSGERDLARFLDAARTAGLSVILCLGPAVNADLTSFGLPDWVIVEPDVQARTSHGTPAWLPQPPRAFPIPSYASSAFHARTKAWFAAVATVIEPHLAPDGPVIALALDDDAPLFFRTGAFDLDYHPDALAWWRDASGLDAPPLEYSAADAARCALWLKFKDEYAARATKVFDAQLDDAGLAGIARLHDGKVSTAHIGASAWLPPEADADDRDAFVRRLATGAKGFRVSMAVERDRHLGAAISTQGKVEATWLQPLLGALAAVEWPTLHRHPRPAIALVDTRADARFGLLTNLVDPVTPALADMLDFGPGGAAELGTDDAAIQSRRWHAAIQRALDLAHVPYTVVDESTQEATLATYRAVIAPTHDRIDRGLLERLRALAEHKRAIVVIGPGTPTRDELDQPHAEPPPKRVGKLKASSLDDEGGLRGLADDLAALAGELPDAWQIERPDDVRAVAFADGGDRVRAVIVMNEAPRPVTAVLLAEGVSLRDPLGNDTLPIVDGRASISLVANGARLLIVDALVAETR